MNYLSGEQAVTTVKDVGALATSTATTIVTLTSQLEAWDKTLAASNDLVTQAKARLEIARLRLQIAEARQSSSGNRMMLYTVGIGLGIFLLAGVAIFGGKKKRFDRLSDQ